MADRYDELESALTRALALEQPELGAFLGELARTDPALHQEIEQLLAYRDVELRIPEVVLQEAVGEPLSETLPLPAGWEERWEHGGLVAHGGMGEVHRLFDRRLDRTVVLKTLPLGLGDQTALRLRFGHEARIHARLRHPNIVPVYDVGELADGRPFILMKDVDGPTLADAIAMEQERHVEGDRTSRIRRLASLLRPICAAVASAHAQGIVHRDLKPANTIAGGGGEIYVLDWGLAKQVGTSELPNPPGAARDATVTALGDVLGTPAYMSPEQALGVVGIDARSDVYSLGAMLYHLVRGERPHADVTGDELLRIVRSRAPVPLARSSPLEPLIDACERAMAREPRDRFATAGELLVAIDDWLEGARLRDRARGLVEGALARREEVSRLQRTAQRRREASEEALRALPPWAPVAEKLPHWREAAEAENQALDAAMADEQLELDLQMALEMASGLRSARAELAERARSSFALAEADRDPQALRRARVRLEGQLRFMADDDPVRVACETWLEGSGTVTLRTDPPGAHVELFRFVEVDRRLVEQPVGELGTTPIEGHRLAMGSYLAVLRHPERAPVRYPFEIARCGDWHGIPPGDERPVPVWLPPRGYFADYECYVPAGWFWVGGDAEAILTLPRGRVWADGFVVQRDMVTHRDYIAHLDALAAAGRDEELEAQLPRLGPVRAGELGSSAYGRDDHGHHVLVPDGDGDLWHPDWPVWLVTWQQARGYAGWLAEQTGRPWRLLGELEHEKAARGADGRYHPWGDHFDPTWCNVSVSRPKRTPVPVDAVPGDVSVYGIRGLAGNMVSWCADAYDEGRVADGIRLPPDPVPASGDEVVCLRGGGWDTLPRAARGAMRMRVEPWSRTMLIGFRLGWSLVVTGRDAIDQRSRTPQ